MFEWNVTVRKERTAGWYAIAGICVASLVVWGFVEGIYALSVVAVIFAGVFLLIENNAPDSVMVNVNENGIGVGSEFYDYGMVENFAIIFDSGAPVLLRLRLTKKGIKTVDVDIPDGSEVSNLRSYLAEHA
ncbi:MAG: hypothetical protein QG650_550, partial [Patescibacteria group bacterium]|nr:hypothetical protein [Patescibacteria group bacterium]